MFVVDRNQTIKIGICRKWNDYVSTSFHTAELSFVDGVEHLCRSFSQMYMYNIYADAQYVWPYIHIFVRMGWQQTLSYNLSFLAENKLLWFL